MKTIKVLPCYFFWFNLEPKLSGFTLKPSGAKCVFLKQPKVSYHGFDSTKGKKKGKGKHKRDEKILFHNSIM